MAHDTSLDNTELQDHSARQPQDVTVKIRTEAAAHPVEDTCLCALLGSSRCGRH